jgi:iron complex transport system permease protein
VIGSRATRAGVALVLILGASFTLALMLGSTRIPAALVIDALMVDRPDEATAVVVRQVRVPRALTAMLAGAALAVAGLQMQTLFRNPLADPFVLGISAGASLGVALVVLGSSAGPSAGFGALGVTGDLAITAAAFGGATMVFAVVLGFAARVINPATILIVGLMAGYAVSAGVTVLVAGTQPERLQQWAQWGFGSFGGVTWQRLRLFAPVVGAGLAVAALTTKHLNVLLLGETYARSMGLPVQAMRTATMCGASLLAAAVTAFCGPIGFLGVAVPHVCRAMLGTSDHRVLVPACMVTGAAAALAAQTIAVLPAGGMLPLNAVTAMLGAPIVVLLLLRTTRGDAAS